MSKSTDDEIRFPRRIHYTETASAQLKNLPPHLEERHNDLRSAVLFGLLGLPPYEYRLDPMWRAILEIREDDLGIYVAVTEFKKGTR